MDLSQLLITLQNALDKTGWLTKVEDNHADLKQLFCENAYGLLEVFTRLDVLIMTPEFNPVDAAGVCICFLFYADPSKVTDMFNLGRIVRQDDSIAFRSQCALVLNSANIVAGDPAVKVLTRPKHQQIKFSKDYSHPAFMVELDYWLSREEFPAVGKNSEVVHINNRNEEQITDARVDAIYALRGAELQEVEESLKCALSDPVPQIRKAALSVLLDYCGDNFQQLAEGALHDDDESVRQLAGESLKAYRKHIRSGLAISTKQSVSDCLKSLTSTNDAVREKAAKDLVGVTDPQIILPLLTVMKNASENLWCRLAAIDALDTFDQPELLDEFNSVLDDEDIGSAAAYKLARKANLRAHEMLFEALCSDNRAAKLSAAKAIGCLANSRALLPLCHMLEDNDYDFKNVALDSMISIFSLGDNPHDTTTDYRTDLISDETKSQLVSSLINAINDKYKDIQGKALQLLSLVDKSQAEPVVLSALEEFIQFDLIDSYSDKDNYSGFNWFEYGLFAAVNNIGNVSFCELLQRLCNAKSWYVRLDAIAALTNLGCESETGVLVDALNNKDWVIRVKAAERLLMVTDSDAWNVLVKALKDDVEDVWFIKKGIIDLLAKSGDKRTFDLFIDILDNTDNYYIYDEIIAGVISWLGMTGDHRAIEAISKWQYNELINCDDDVVEKALNNIHQSLAAILPDHSP